MTSKGLHVRDNSVAERRLRLIYDWLENNNNKKALQECDKVLKKTPNLHCAKALKALTLYRMGKEAESVNILEHLTVEKPTDVTTLQAMTMCYREMRQLNKVCELYETAIKEDPSNEELHTQLFMSYVRIGDFKSQQQTAMTLYKHAPKNPYYSWAVMSIVLQATRGQSSQDQKKRTLLLSLAERMMDKMIADNKLEAEPEVQLYVMILDLQEKFDKILTVLEGPLGNSLVSLNPLQNRLKYCIKLERWSDVNVICKQLLNESVDRWDLWKEYINSVFCLAKLHDKTNNGGGQDSEESEVDDTVDKAHEFICRSVESVLESGAFLRGPYLARFELLSRIVNEKTESNNLLGDTVELFIEYFRKFGHKSCCVWDLRMYLNLLNEDQKVELASRLLQDVGISSTSIPQSEAQMQKHICALQLSRMCGSHRNLSEVHLKALVTALTLHYQHGYQSYGQNLLSTDLGPSDPYALLAAHVLYDLANLEQNSKYIIVALGLLEGLLANSPSNFHAKLLSIRLHHTLGNGLCAHAMYNSLDIKHLQLDSLGFIHCARLPVTGLFSLCTNLFDTTLRFFSSNYEDSSDHLTFSYKFGSFIKLDEFMDFRERLNNSIHYTTVAIDRIILSLIIECTNVESLYNLDISSKDNSIDWDSLKDNHDLSVNLSWDPERIAETPEKSVEVQKLFEHDVSFLKLRATILWCLSAAMDIVKSSNENRQTQIVNLQNMLNDWEIVYKKVKAANYTPISQKNVNLPLPSRLHVVLKLPFYEIVSGFFTLLLSIARNNINLTSLEELKNALKKLQMFIEDNAMKEENSFQEGRHAMEIMVNCVEIISIATVISLLCNELVKPQHGKRNKKKSSSEIKSREYLISVLQELKAQINCCCDVIQRWIDLYATQNMSNLFESLSLNIPTALGERAQAAAQSLAVASSYIVASKEIQTVLKNKLKVVNSMID